MITVPGFLLRRLYVKGSLKATPGGLEFQLKNGLGSGYAHKLWPLKVDGIEVPPGSAVFVLDGEETAFAEVSKAKTLIADIVNKPVDKALMEDLARRIAARRATDEGKEGMSAFLERRKPDWID